MASWALGGGFGEGGAEATESSDSSGGHTAFQWGGTLSAIFLLILRYTRRRSSMPSTLLVLYLFTSFPTVLFKILSIQWAVWMLACLSCGCSKSLLPHDLSSVSLSPICHHSRRPGRCATR